MDAFTWIRDREGTVLETLAGLPAPAMPGRVQGSGDRTVQSKHHLLRALTFWQEVQSRRGYIVNESRVRLPKFKSHEYHLLAVTLGKKLWVSY